MNSISQKIRRFRLMRNYTQVYMAQQLQISPKWYGQLERGKARIHVDDLEKIASLLEVTLEDLLHDSVPEFLQPKTMEENAPSRILSLRVTEEQLSRIIQNLQGKDSPDFRQE